MSKTYEIEIQKDTETGDAFFELPNELMKKLDWNPGDDLKWDETNEGIRCRKIKYETVELEFDDEEYFLSDNVDFGFHKDPNINL